MGQRNEQDLSSILLTGFEVTQRVSTCDRTGVQGAAAGIITGVEVKARHRSLPCQALLLSRRYGCAFLRNLVLVGWPSYESLDCILQSQHENV